jgi:hypothetical protein
MVKFFILMLSLIIQASYAQEVISSMPAPTNDQSLEYKPRPTKKIHLVKPAKHLKNSKHTAKKNSTKPLGPHLRKRQSGKLVIYYALPATACCGPTLEIKKANCCTAWEHWTASHYAAFNVSAEDLIYSERNNDRDLNLMSSNIIEEVVEDPR